MNVAILIIGFTKPAETKMQRFLIKLYYHENINVPFSFSKLSKHLGGHIRDW
jgi:hypothetical protein